jgi:putative acetyltransferase
LKNFQIRPSLDSDYPLLVTWLLEPGVMQWFPMDNLKEVEDAARIWLSYTRLGSCFTAEIDGIPCGSVLLNIYPFKKARHQCLLSIVVSESFRNQGVGKALIEFIEKVAFEKFGIELLHLEVYENNPAKRLYDRMGYIQYGVHPKFLKEENGFKAKILMQKWLNRKD